MQKSCCFICQLPFSFLPQSEEEEEIECVCKEHVAHQGCVNPRNFALSHKRIQTGENTAGNIKWWTVDECMPNIITLLSSLPGSASTELASTARGEAQQNIAGDCVKERIKDLDDNVLAMARFMKEVQQDLKEMRGIMQIICARVQTLKAQRSTPQDVMSRTTATLHRSDSSSEGSLLSFEPILRQGGASPVTIKSDPCANISSSLKFSQQSPYEVTLAYPTESLVNAAKVSPNGKFEYNDGLASAYIAYLHRGCIVLRYRNIVEVLRNSFVEDGMPICTKRLEFLAGHLIQERTRVLFMERVVKAQQIVHKETKKTILTHPSEIKILVEAGFSADFRLFDLDTTTLRAIWSDKLLLGFSITAGMSVFVKFLVSLRDKQLLSLKCPKHTPRLEILSRKFLTDGCEFGTFDEWRRQLINCPTRKEEENDEEDYDSEEERRTRKKRRVGSRRKGDEARRIDEMEDEDEYSEDDTSDDSNLDTDEKKDEDPDDDNSSSDSTDSENKSSQNIAETIALSKKRKLHRNSMAA